MRVWKQTPYDPAFSVPALTSSPDSEEFRDEAIWQVARHLDDLYVTIPFSEQDEALIPLEDHRYETHLGAAVLPSPEARSKLPVTIWDMVLRDLTHSVYADFLLWCLQRNLPETPVMDVINSSASTLDFLTAGRRSSSAPPPGGSWETALSEAAKNAPTELATRLRQTVSSITYDLFNSLLAEFLLLLPSSLGTSFAAQIPGDREELIAAGCTSLLPPTSPEGLDDLLVDYLSEFSRRQPIEVEANRLLEWHATERDHKVLFELRGDLTADLEAQSLGFSLLRRRPEAFERMLHPETVDPEPHPSLCFAYFPRIRARHVEEAVYRARTRLTVWLSLLGVVDRRPIDYQILRTWAVNPDLPFPLLQGPIVVPLALAHKLWNDLLAESEDLFNGDDELATRIRQAFVHLDRAQRAADAEDRFDEAWRVLEILAGNATRDLFTTVSYLPLYFVPKDFAQMPPPQQEALVADVYKRHRRYLSSAKTFRNRRVVHRELTGTDIHVFDHNAQWLLSFARTVLRAVYAARDAGARTPREVISRLEAAYERHFKLPLRRVCS